MQIENGKLIFEVTKCTLCSGTGKIKHGIFCINENKKQRGKPCKVCGSKNKRDHKIVTYKIVNCNYCNGTGKKMENRFSHIADHLVEPIIAMINFTFRNPEIDEIDLDQSFISSCYRGKNSFAGGQDYIDHRKSSAKLILEKVLKSVRGGYTHQALNYIDSENNILTKVSYWGYYGGYTAQWI